MTISKFRPPQNANTTHHTNRTLRSDLNTREAADYLSVSTALLEKWRCKGGGPRYVKYGARIVRYRREDLDAYRNRYRQEG